MRRAVMVLVAMLALMFGGASIAMGADHNRPEGNENSPCAEDHPGAASEKNPHCTGEGPPGHQRENRETDTVEAEQDAGETEEAAEEEDGDEAAEEDGGEVVAEEEDGDEAAEEDGGDEVAEEDGDGDVAEEEDGDEVEGDAGADGDAEEGDAAADEDDGDDVAAGADALADGGVVTDVLLILDDFFGDLFVITDEADEVEVG